MRTDTKNVILRLLVERRLLGLAQNKLMEGVLWGLNMRGLLVMSDQELVKEYQDLGGEVDQQLLMELKLEVENGLYPTKEEDFEIL